MPKIDLLFFQGKLKSFEGSSRTVEGVTRSIHVTKGILSDSALTQGLVEKFSRLVILTQI